MHVLGTNSYVPIRFVAIDAEHTGVVAHRLEQLTLCELMLKLVCSLVTFNFSAIPLAILSLATPAVLSLLKNNNKVPFGIIFWTAS